jgi:zinc protease
VFALDVTVWEGVSIDRAERALMEEIEKIRKTPPSGHELERAIAQIKAQYAYTLDGVARQGFVIGIFEMITSFETMARLVEKLEKISPAKVSEIAAKYLSDQNRTVCRCIGVRNNHGS